MRNPHFNLELKDPKERVSRLICRKEGRNAVRVILDLRSGFRGEVDGSTWEDRVRTMHIRTRKSSGGRWDYHFVDISWSLTEPLWWPYCEWSKGTLEIVLMRFNDDQATRWETVYERPYAEEG